MDAKDVKSEPKDDPKIYTTNNDNPNLYNPPPNIPPPPPRRESEGGLSQTGTMYWMRIEDYATQIRIVALQARCGASVSLEQIQKAHELALKMQEDLRPLLMNAAQAPQLFSSTTPGIFQGRPIINGMNPNWSDKPTYSPMKNTMSVFSNNDSNKMFSQQQMSETSPKTIKRQKRKRQQDELERSCKNCNTTETPEWRRGPLGPRTLCNACGLKWAKKIKAEKNRPEGTDFTDDESNNASVEQTSSAPTPPRPNSTEFTPYIQTNTSNNITQSPNIQKPLQSQMNIFSNQTVNTMHPQSQSQQVLLNQNYSPQLQHTLQSQQFQQHPIQQLQHQMHTQNHINSPPSMDRQQLPVVSHPFQPHHSMQMDQSQMQMGQQHLIQTQSAPIIGGESLQDHSNQKNHDNQMDNIHSSPNNSVSQSMNESHLGSIDQHHDLDGVQGDEQYSQMSLSDKLDDQTDDDQTNLHIDSHDLPPSPQIAQVNDN